MWDDKRKKELGDRNHRRALCCSKCNGYVQFIDGAKLDPASHFAGITYRVCPGCGHEDVKPSRKGRKGSL